MIQKKKKFNMDQFGFIHEEQYQSEDAGDPQKLLQINARIEQWRKMLPNIEQLIKSNDSKLQERVRKGIPNSIRMKVWPFLAGVKEIQEELKLDYETLINQADFPYQGDIEVDLLRTFPNHFIFKQGEKGKENVGLQSLRNILKALSLTFSEMGYCQGINFIAAGLIFYLQDEDVYWILCSIMQQYDCLMMFQDVGSITKNLFIYEKFLQQYLPSIPPIMKNFDINSMFYATPWFMTLFSGVLPFKYFAHFIDVFLFEGPQTIYRVSLAIMKLLQQKIIEAQSFEDVMALFREYDQLITIDSELFFQSATQDFIFSRKLIVEYEKLFFKEHPQQLNQKPQVNNPSHIIDKNEKMNIQSNSSSPTQSVSSPDQQIDIGQHKNDILFPQSEINQKQ